MKKSKLRNRFLKEKTEASRKVYNIQRNYCVNLLKKAKREYFANIKINNIADISLPESPSIKEPSVEIFTDPVILALEKYKDHPSITSIKCKITSMDNPKFSFRFVSLNKALTRVNKLNRRKASQATDIPVKLAKKTNMLCLFMFFIISTMHY